MSEAVRFELINKNGDVLYGLNWANKEAKANVIICEGMEEHSSRYDAFAKFLNENGYDVYCLDCYGQGQNVLPDESNKGMWPRSGFRRMVQAIDQLVLKISTEEKPTYIFSHSMGSFMMQDYIQRYSHKVKKVVLCGSGAKNPMATLGYLLAKLIVNEKNRFQKAKLLNTLMFGNFNRGIDNPRTEYDWLSFNEENVDRYIADPLSGFGPNNGFCLEFLKGMKRLHKKKYLNRIKKDINLFIISGDQDPVTNFASDVEKLAEEYRSLGLTNVSTKVYENMRHEILNEKNCEIVYKDILEFLNK